jgi:hypothetical protein
MAVTAATNDPNGLWAGIVAGIQDKRIQTWDIVQQIYLTHSVDQWLGKAYFRPAVQHGSLVFQIVPPQGQKVSGEVYAIYHGRLMEMLLAHFPQQFSQVSASSTPISGDSVGSAV